MPLIKPIKSSIVNPTHPLAKGLVGCWLLNEGTGNKISDLSGHGNSGTIYGSPAWSAGPTGGCLEFVNGNSQYINVGNSYFGMDKTNSLSIVTFACRTSSDPTYAPIIQRGGYVFPFGFKLYKYGSYTRIYFSVRTGPGNTNMSSLTDDIPLGQWAQFAGTFDGTTQSVYHNGRFSNSVANSGSLDFNSASHLTYLGAVEGFESEYTHDGGLAYVFLWNLSLSAAQIAWLSREPFAMFETGIAPALISVRTSIVSISGSISAQTNLSASLGLIKKVNGNAAAVSDLTASVQLIPYRPGNELTWLSDILFNAMTANAFKLGTILSLGWFWLRTSGCSALYRRNSMDEIDFANILVVVDMDESEISPPGYLPHADCSTYFYVIRRFNNIGYREQTLRAAAKVTIDQNENLAGPEPNKIFAAKAIQTDSNEILLVWFYCPIEQKSKPVRFNVYGDNRTGQIDFENPIGTIDYQGKKFYSFRYEINEPGRYLFAVKTEDAESIENNTSAKLCFQTSNTNPNPIGILNTAGV